MALCVSLFAGIVAAQNLNLALPALAVELQMTQLELTWVVEAFVLVFAALLFVAAAVGDRYGRRLVLQIGLVIFFLASLYAGLVARTGGELIAARAVMGLGGALVMPTTLSVINVTFPPSQRARAIAIWAAIAGTGMIFGNVISGILLEIGSWE